MTYVVAASLTSKEGQADRVRELREKVTPLVREREPGNLYYQAHVSSTDPNVFFVYEVYVDEAAFESHRQSPHFQELIVGSAFELLAKREGASYTALK